MVGFCFVEDFPETSSTPSFFFPLELGAAQAGSGGRTEAEEQWECVDPG